ncbi:MAG: chemotaxis protein CheW [Candidatus Tumulicola sp.]
MLFLLFELDGERYALDATEIVEVLPLAQSKSIPGAPAWVAGVFERHGCPMPVIDMPMLALGRTARRLRSTRLVLVRYRTADSASATARENGEPEHVLGLILERATQARRIDREKFADSGVAIPHARWLGPVASDAVGLVQWIKVQQMLDDDVKALLFQQAMPKQPLANT